MKLKPIHNLFRWANLALVLFTLLAYLAPNVNPSNTWLFSVLGLAFPFFLFFNIAFIMFWLWRRHIYFLFSLGTILIGFTHFNNYLGWHFIKDKTAGSDEITVMTFNVAGFSGNAGKKALTWEQSLERLNELAEKAKPEILCLQEVSNQMQIDAVKKIFGLKHHYKSKGTVLFSKFPFVKQDELNFKNAENGCLWAEVETPFGRIRVYNLHLQSNKMTLTATRITTEGDLREAETWKDIRFVLARYKNGTQVRSAQAGIIAEHISKSSVPVIVCGDLNDTPISYVYNKLSGNLNDSFREKGHGMGATFAGRLPGLRIDYVLADKRFQIRFHKVFNSELSDHFPVVVRLSW